MLSFLQEMLLSVRSAQDTVLAPGDQDRACSQGRSISGGDMGLKEAATGGSTVPEAWGRG